MREAQSHWSARLPFFDGWIIIAPACSRIPLTARRPV
jgi:hypothetical protein